MTNTIDNSFHANAKTRLKCLSVFALSFFALVSSCRANAASSSDVCAVPSDLRVVISKNYVDARIVTLDDLEIDDRAFFQKDHPNDCPGVAKVDFYGDGKPTLALLLTWGASKEPKLFVAHRTRQKWVLMLLSPRGNSIPYAAVIWVQQPGEYRDVYGDKTIRATRETIVYCKYEAWAILYAWTGKRVEKVWLLD